MLSALGFLIFMGCMAFLTVKEIKLPAISVPIVGILPLLIISVTESILVRPEIPVTVIFYGILFSKRQQRSAPSFRSRRDFLINEIKPTSVLNHTDCLSTFKHRRPLSNGTLHDSR
jgi:hypothetical protein